MSKLFEEALNDAKKLKEIAEQNATNKIIEAVAPRIKQLIESELMDDSGESIEFFDEESSEDEAEELPAVEDLGIESEAADDLVSDAGAALPSEMDPIDLSGLGLDMEQGSSAPTEFSFEKDGKQVKVSVTVEGKQNKTLKKMGVSKLLRALNETSNPRLKKAIMQEIRNIRKKLIIMSEAGDKTSKLKLNALNLILKENTKMSTKKSRLNENAWWLLKEEDEEGNEEELDLDLDMEDEGGEDEGGDVDVEAIKSAVEDLAAALNMEVGEEAGEDLDLEDEDEDEDEDMDLDLEEMDRDETYGMDETYHEVDEEDEDEVMEISESMLRREITKMTRGSRARRPSRGAQRARARLAESRRRRMARRRRLAEMGDPMAAMHGLADEVIEVTEEDLINALAEELGSSTGAELNIDKSGDASKAAGHFGGGKVDGPALAESRRLRRANAKAKRQLVEAKREAAAAKKELKESNLFNAKLLYVNKLMQSYDLNGKQQRAIVEALDNAKTLREAKLLYTTLTDSLKKGRSANKGSTMNESVSRTGSASKSVRSSAPAKNGTELGRWAVLAGLNK